VASADECRKAVADLVTSLADVDPVLRAKHVPRRQVACTVSDLDLSFCARLDEHGLHDVVESPGRDVDCDVRLTLTSDELLALASGDDDFLHAWLRGRVTVSAGMRDLLRLRSLFGI
jgi:predicted lipid carrier protein YhbT